MGLAYKRCCTGPLRDLGFTLVLSSAAYWVLMHARIDARSLLPLSVFDWNVIAVSVCDMTTPSNTPIHPMSITLISLCAIFTELSSFWLVPVSTGPDIEGLHHWKPIAAVATPCCSRMAHITVLVSLGGPN